jgi:hypothetical protein
MAACGYFDKRRLKKEQQLNANSTASQSFSSGETNPWLFQSDSTKLRSARANRDIPNKACACGDQIIKTIYNHQTMRRDHDAARVNDGIYISKIQNTPF